MAEGFFFSLDVLYRGLGISKLQFLIKKISNFFSAANYFQFFVIKTLDPDGYSAKNAGSGSVLCESGPETLINTGPVRK
jgi:hypothetical protein